ncbi:hypothetical protein V1227_26270 [Lentzea sp. DG1S-22]|uniref:hypothetical protein n=1 Tax=Lentzea sp. DG1S-22 TaxID=3108822 RepID=UPI002E7A03A5|nr:hypothetical protein [Lentzea sp. DG1S-22]WVH78559.1 hypothetical protein V1227_26270 [Lentzea sp. DG1S-22]
MERVRRGCPLCQRNLDPDALEWLLSRQDGLPLGARHLRLTVEAGFAYAVIPEHVHPAAAA